MSREQDRELLEAAATAAGYTIRGGNQVVEIRGVKYFIGRTEGKGWNPLEDDADAFRLMVDCGIHVRFYGATICCETMEGQYLADEVDPIGDMYTATRRAIVRAAAAMSEGQE